MPDLWRPCHICNSTSGLLIEAGDNLQGLSEPLGALIALLLVKPFITEEPLHYILAFVGGIMMSVCAIELWPEAKRCKEDARLAQGIFAGTVVMAVTLAMGV